MGVFGSIGINFGQNLQADGIQGLPVELRETMPHKSHKWRVGMAIFILFSIVNFAALAFAPASILVPLESIQFVTNVAYSYFVHRKRVTLRMLLGVGFACVGTVVTVVFGAQGSGCHSLRELSGTWYSPVWWSFCGSSIFVAFAALRVHIVYERELRAGNSPWLHRYVQPLTFTLTAALLGGAQMIVQSKVFSELLAKLFQGELAVFTSWIFYVSLLLVVGCGMIWVVKLTQCLGLYDPLLILPLMVATYILFGGVAGGLYFDEFSTLHDSPGGYWRWVLYVSGMSMVMLALYLIATSGIEETDLARRSNAEVDKKQMANSGTSSASAARVGSPSASGASSLVLSSSRTTRSHRSNMLLDHLDARDHALSASHMPTVESPLFTLARSVRIGDAIAASLSSLGSIRRSSHHRDTGEEASHRLDAFDKAQEDGSLPSVETVARQSLTEAVASSKAGAPCHSLVEHEPMSIAQNADHAVMRRPMEAVVSSLI